MKNFALMFLAVIAGGAVVIFAYEKLKDREKHQYINAAYVTQGMAGAMSYKMLIREYWAENGKLPCSDKELQIEPGTIGGNQALDAMEVTDCGQITLTYNEMSGMPGGTLVLEATETKNATGISLKWTCHTDSFESITKYVPQCLFEHEALDQARSGFKSATKPGSKKTPPTAVAGTVPVVVAESQCGDTLLYRSIFSDAVEERVPQKRIVTIGPGRDKIFFFTEIIGGAGTEVSHHWYHNGTAVATVPFEVKADRWRTWSSKRLEALGPGTIKVDVKEGDCLIDSESVLIADKEQIDPAGIQGWQRPMQAFETYLARQARQDEGTMGRRKLIDDAIENGDTRLLAAIRRGDTDRAMKLIRWFDFERLDGWKQLPVEEITLYRAQANPFLRDADNVSPIDLAHRLGQTEVVNALIESATNIEQWGDSTIGMLASHRGGFVRFEDGDTPLTRAIRTGNERAVLTMLQLGVPRSSTSFMPRVDLFTHDASGRQPLDIARDEGRHGIERMLLMALQGIEPKWAVSRQTFATEMNGSEPGNCRKAATETDPLVYFFTELTDMAGKTVKHDWKFNGRTVQSNTFDIKTQRWSVQSSREFSSQDIGNWDVEVTTDAGVLLKTARLAYIKLPPKKERYPNYLGPKCDEMGSGALYSLIASHGPIGKIQYLVDKGTRFSPKSIQGRELFAKMITEGNISLTRWFLNNGFDIESAPTSQMTPLMLAAKQGDVPMTLYLIKRGAEVNKLRYKDHHTALQIAASRNKPDVAKALIDNGADPNLPDKRGVTALARAIGSCGMDVTLVLLEHGGDPNIADKKGKRPRDGVDICLRQAQWSADKPEIAALINQDS